MIEWVPQLRDTVRFKDTSEASKWYTVRGVDDSDKTALILCTDGQQPLPGWVCWDMLELVDDAFTSAAIDQDARDQERFDAGYKAGYEAAQREWMRMQEGEECKPPERNADGLRIVWDWSPWLRFLAARAALIHEALGEGKSVAYIRDWLSMDEGQVRLIGATELRSIPGTPGAVWPPNEFQELGRQVKDPK